MPSFSLTLPFSRRRLAEGIREEKEERILKPKAQPFQPLIHFFFPNGWASLFSPSLQQPLPSIPARQGKGKSGQEGKGRREEER